MPSLEWSIVGTLAWFNLRGRALSLPELHRLLLRHEATEEAVSAALAGLDVVIERDDLYSLEGTDVIYPSAQTALYYRRKWRQAHWAVGLIRHLPYVRMVSVVNTVADKTAKPESDVDLFIVIEHSRLYLTRTLITGLLHVFRLRRHGRLITDRMCLSWFASTEGMEIEPITFPPYDLLLAYLFTEQVPLIDSDGTYDRFMQRNRWIGGLVPAYDSRSFRPRKLSLFSRLAELVLNNQVGQSLEGRLERWQRERITAKSPRNLEGDGAQEATPGDPPTSDPPRHDERADVQIIATDRMLKFHEKERRGVYREEWERLMRRLGYEPNQVREGLESEPADAN